MKRVMQKIMLGSVFVMILAVFACLSHVIQRSHDPEHYVKTLLCASDGALSQAFFSPDDNLKELLVSLISCEKKRIDVAIYTLTHKEIAQALLDAHHRGVHIECAVDRSYASDRYSKVARLANHQVPVWVYQTEEINGSLMHNKFMIFYQNIDNKKILWTGSYNFTQRANTANQENVIITDNSSITDKYSIQFQKLKTRCLQISGKPGTYLSEPTQDTHSGRIGSWIQGVFRLFG